MELIEEDLDDLRALFHAEGEGLPMSEIQQMCLNVNDLLTVLQLDTDILIENLKQVLPRLSHLYILLSSTRSECSQLNSLHLLHFSVESKVSDYIVQARVDQVL